MSRGIYLIDSLASDALGLHDAAQRLEPLGSSAVSWLGTSAVSPAQDRTICLRDRVCAGALAGSGPSPRGTKGWAGTQTGAGSQCCALGPCFPAGSTPSAGRYPRGVQGDTARLCNSYVPRPRIYTFAGTVALSGLSRMSVDPPTPREHADTCPPNTSADTFRCSWTPAETPGDTEPSPHPPPLLTGVTFLGEGGQITNKNLVKVKGPLPLKILFTLGI